MPCDLNGSSVVTVYKKRAARLNGVCGNEKLSFTNRNTNLKPSPITSLCSTVRGLAAYEMECDVVD